ncbi:hypothetical protein [Lichenibacterium ramalinae]|uniref:Uncharacterized protein n=1 Tax=Lichenibacterium ramalinae TaxID=2316527 RepID=A0A4Q2R9H0_9HYPH|nr:hypothetical protein [Lichenibacterium ramalinae]RYB02415.1 hypothetical protein D3272_21035 [Lichenibacterium ramalinae]
MGIDLSFDALGECRAGRNVADERGRHRLDGEDGLLDVRLLAAAKVGFSTRPRRFAARSGSVMVMVCQLLPETGVVDASTAVAVPVSWSSVVVMPATVMGCPEDMRRLRWFTAGMAGNGVLGEPGLVPTGCLRG